MGYRLTPAAETDLRNIYFNGVEQFGQRAADLYAERLTRTLERLGDQPRMARERTEFVPPLRVHPTGAHLILYRIEGDDVLVLRVRHGREDWQAN